MSLSDIIFANTLYFINTSCHGTDLMRCYGYARTWCCYDMSTDLTPERRVYIPPYLCTQILTRHRLSIIHSTLYLVGTYCDTSFIQIYAISSTKISSVHAIKYFYLVNLFIIINILLYFCPIIGSFNFSNFTIKSYNITFYGLLTNLTNYNNPYSLYLLGLFL